MPPLKQVPRSEAIAYQLLLLACVGSILASVLVLVAFIAQPILDAYAFRQTQTALTAYWFVQEGFRLAYITPVLGSPWSVPFEFPLYQGLVALIVGTGSLSSLVQIGRTISWIFSTATLFPVWLICKDLKLPRSVFPAFATLYLASPLYLFWGRTFMIESTALFFTIAFLASTVWIASSSGTPGTTRVIFAVVMGSLAVLQKATTALPVIVFMGLMLLLPFLTWPRQQKNVTIANVFVRTIIVTVPLAIGSLWYGYVDVVKGANEIGALLTSQALRTWNFGTLEQRASSSLWIDVIWTRTFVQNLGGWLGLTLFALSVLLCRDRRLILAMTAAAILFFLPLAIFTGLHIVHQYYQCATTIYAIFVLAIALACLETRATLKISVIVLAAIVLLNLSSLRQTYWTIATDQSDSRTLIISTLVRESSDHLKPILVYGFDWSSEVAFYSERKSLTVPDWFPDGDNILSNVEKYLGTSKLGAIVICPEERVASIGHLQEFLTAADSYQERRIGNCMVYVWPTTA